MKFMKNNIPKHENSHFEKEMIRNVKDALKEDLGENFQTFTKESQKGEPIDLTGSIIDPSKTGKAIVFAKEKAIFCGKLWFEQTFNFLSKDIEIAWNVNDGQQLMPDEEVCEIIGPIWAILAGERTSLNFAQTLSGTATSTSELIVLLENSSTKILDTRKTIPGLRFAQKYAVSCGGGFNHRLGLFDAILIKENHITAGGGIEEALRKLKENFPERSIEIEVENLNQLEEVLEFGADIVLLDNFSINDILDAIRMVDNKIKIEISGNINPEKLKQLAKLNIDYISIGSLTKNIRAIDFSMIVTDVT